VHFVPAKSWHLFRKIRKSLTKRQGRKMLGLFGSLKTAVPLGKKVKNYIFLKETKR
jgi:hypothetical protein